jgi:hypothetical protein
VRRFAVAILEAVVAVCAPWAGVGNRKVGASAVDVSLVTIQDAICAINGNAPTAFAGTRHAVTRREAACSVDTPRAVGLVIAGGSSAVNIGLALILYVIVAGWLATGSFCSALGQVTAERLAVGGDEARIASNTGWAKSAVVLPAAVDIGLPAILQSVVTGRLSAARRQWIALACLTVAVLEAVCPKSAAVAFVAAAVDVGLGPVLQAIGAADGLTGAACAQARGAIGVVLASSSLGARLDALATAVDVSLSGADDSIGAAHACWPARCPVAVAALAVGVCGADLPISTRAAVAAAIHVGLRTIANQIRAVVEPLVIVAPRREKDCQGNAQ